MDDAEMARRLRLIAAIRTGRNAVRNDIVEVNDTYVVIRSENGSEDRQITFAMIRGTTAETTTHGVIRRVLAQILGLYEGDYEYAVEDGFAAGTLRRPLPVTPRLGPPVASGSRSRGSRRGPRGGRSTR